MENKEKIAVKLGEKSLDKVHGGIELDIKEYDAESGTSPDLFCGTCGSYDIVVVNGHVMCKACAQKKASSADVSYRR